MTAPGMGSRHAAAAPGDTRPDARAGLAGTVLAIAFAAGIACARLQPAPFVWPWLLTCAAVLATALALRRRTPRVATALLMIAVLAFGASWATIRHHHVATDDLAAHIGTRPRLVRLSGVIATSPNVRDRTAGSMGLFSYRRPATYFQLDVDGVVDRHGVAHPARGTVLVRVDETIPPCRTGDRADVLGTLSRFPAPMNPGEFDLAAYARTLGQAGLLRVPNRGLVRVSRVGDGGVATAIARARETLRTRASGWVLANLPPTGRAERDALLAALLLGERGPDLDGLGDAFRRVGLAHLLAISGLHLGVLAGFVVLALRFGGRERRWHGLVVIGVVLVYLLLIEARQPVLRAGIMTIAASLGLVMGHRLAVGGLVALSGVVLLLRRPDELFTPGFQLSYGVVLGLIHLSPVFRAKWFGPRERSPATSTAILREWLRDSIAVAVTAWAVATPIVAHHFGMVTPLAAPASVVTVPIVGLLLGLGYVKMILALALPSLGVVVGAALAVAADLLVSIVQVLDALPYSVVQVPNPSTVWTLAAVALVAAWFLNQGRRRRHLIHACVGVMVVWMMWPLIARGPTPLRIDMLAVGDGSCFVVRSGRSAVVFDAGSAGDLDAGRRMIVPTLRHLGVTSLDAIVLSHANMDHYSAVIELVETFGVRVVFVTPQLIETAERDPTGPVAFLLDRLTDAYVSVSTVGAGSSRTFGESTWTWLHPDRRDRFDRANDTSMVVRIEAGGRRVLLCGDIEREAMSRLLDSSTDLAADVLELPHHGSHHDLARAFVERVGPDVVMQSTGWGRWSRDRWAEDLAGVERLVTARDGACRVMIDDDRSISVGRFRPDP